jgi:hypothetical protein
VPGTDWHVPCMCWSARVGAAATVAGSGYVDSGDPSAAILITYQYD